MITLTIRIESEEYPEWVSEALKTGKEFHGVKVSAASNGDMFKRCDILEKKLGFFEDKADFDYLDSEEEEQLKKWEEEYERTWEREA